MTGLQRGRYCLRSTADPSDQLVETDNTDNVAEQKLRLNVKRGVLVLLSRGC